MRNERLLAFVEAATITGPAKNLLDFCRVCPFDAHIATFSRGTGSNEFVDAVRQAGIGITVIPERRSFDFGVTKTIAKLVDELGPGIIQTHAVKSHFLLALSGARTRAKWVAFHHGYTATDMKMRLYNQLDRWSLRKPDRLVTVSHAFERQLVNRGVDPSRISILQNAVNPDWAGRVRAADVAALRQRLGIGPEENVVIALGRMSVEKAHCDLISAFHLLRRERQDIRLVLVGDGPERAALEKIAGDGVIFIGQTADVAPFFAIASVMALPSLTEGSPNVLLEAMACGVPSAATSVGGIPEIVSDGESALLVPPREPAKMAAAISRLLTEPELARRITGTALDVIARRHSVEARTRALCELYAKL
ncbi:MAG: glycosyltransferase family 4 protein [Acidobacteriota bacterium]|nr:glycosyltransferase family 4 protein [Acidobacteriota bacterium]